MSSIRDLAKMNLGDGQAVFKKLNPVIVSENDVMAAKILEYISELIGESGNNGDAMDVLTSSMWWLIYADSSQAAQRSDSQ